MTSAKKPANAGLKSEDKITIQQVRSSAGADKRTKATLRSLGLGRIGNKREITNDAAVAGQIARVSHLVEICSQ